MQEDRDDSHKKQAKLCFFEFTYRVALLNSQ